ncbi:EAL domain-containing protein [Desulfopila sp. IMCC35006]|uniref:EAL domain-containing protein n=1 Tax=Desulfopila sp. IMCC35006 TaxID=2569542 RepID=UPI0010ABCA08|nr:EAL domain-containing protein [Desulfopila sp. IMCC35006]TKB25523.1 EAL domain-containing protein [Desulfopila sp. IMCC35006]
MLDKTSLDEKPLALVVDDDLSLRLSMCAALAKAGFATVEAENGREAVEIFQSDAPDIILLDVVMPEMDGFATCSAIRSMPTGKYTQILMVTGLDDTESIERAFEAGANDFVAKPINWTMLGHRGKYMLRAGRAMEELNKSKRRLAKTQELALLGNWEIDLINNSFHCSPEAGRLLGLTKVHRQISYNDFLASVAIQEQDRVKEKIDSAVKFKRPFSINYRVILPDGAQRHILNRCEIFFNENGVEEMMLGAVQDVTQLKNAEEEIRLLAFYDSLTGLANRTLFMDRLGHEIASANRHGKIFALLFLDLDQFKRINDSFGHHIGDLLLKNVSETLQKCIRKSDSATGPVLASDSDTLIARLGGDEFIILLSDIQKPENAAIVARKIIQAIPTVYVLEGHEISVTTSIGISIFPVDGKDMELLLKNADSAMYHAKEKGRNNYQFYKNSLNDAVSERYSLEQGMRNALKRDEFVLYYQPQIELATRRIVGAEALIRWLHPQKGMIPPDKFIPIAEETGLIIDINKWVIQTACRQNEQWRQADLKPIRIAVNLSGYQLASQNIIQIIQEALADADLDSSNLEIEITENVFMQETKDTIGILKQMKDLKLRIALDDFGTGYSSLSYLTTFPVDVIKIDRSFVMGCTMLENSRVIIKAIIAMGHSLGSKIVAEGIETEEQFELIKGYGADEGQGYLFSPPVNHIEFARLLAQECLL